MSGFAFVRNVWFWFLYEMSCVRNVVCTNCRAPIGDIPNVCKNSSVAMFADVTTLITSGKWIDSILNVDIGHTSKWLACNKLTINIDKCETMFFGCGKPSNILLDKTIIPYQNSVKIRGVHIDAAKTNLIKIGMYSEELSEPYFSGKNLKHYLIY